MWGLILSFLTRTGAKIAGTTVAKAAVSGFSRYKLYIVLAIIIGLGAVIGVQHLQKAHLHREITGLTQQIVDIKAESALKSSIIGSQHVTITHAAASLAECNAINNKLQADAASAVKILQIEVEQIRDKADIELRKVKEALQHETCAIVAVPDDVSSVLRAGVARAKGDS